MVAVIIRLPFQIIDGRLGPVANSGRCGAREHEFANRKKRIPGTGTPAPYPTWLLWDFSMFYTFFTTEQNRMGVRGSATARGEGKDMGVEIFKDGNYECE